MERRQQDSENDLKHRSVASRNDKYFNQSDSHLEALIPESHILGQVKQKSVLLSKSQAKKEKMKASQ